MIAPTPYDRVQYTLSYKGEMSVTISEIKNWGTDEKEYVRNNDYDGIFQRFSTDLIFVEDGRDFLILIDEIYGANSEIFIKKEERHPRTDEWVETYFGFLDLMTLNVDETTATVKMNSGGIEQLLKVRESEQIEVDRLDTLDGSVLPELETVGVTMNGRKIFLLSKMEDSTPPSFSVYYLTRYISPIQNKTVSSDPMVLSTYKHTDETYFVGYNTNDNTKTFPQKQQFFYYGNDRLKYLELTFDIDINVIFNNTSSALQFIKIKIQKSKIGNDPLEPDPVQLYDVIYLNGDGSSGMQNLTYTNDPHPFVFELQEDECLAVVWELMQSTQPNDRNYFELTKNDLTITENSFFEATRCKMILAEKLGQRLANIITDKDCFFSNDVGENGIASGTGFAHGFWIREFEKDTEDETNRFKPLTTSWKDFMEAMRVTWKMGVGIDLKGKRERLRMERKSFFYNPNVTIRLPNIVSNLKEATAPEYYFSGIEAGYEKGGEYEESMGLDEYNGKSTFTTVITRIKNIFKIVSPYRTDSYGAEFARRKTRRYYPTTDTRYDQDIFQFDLKIQNYQWQDSQYIIRKWEDDFEDEPENVYSPETAYNLRYSPANLILRHGWELASSFIKYPLDWIRYASSNANSKLLTKLIGGVQVSENSDIQNKDLGKAKFIPKWVTFEHQCDFDVMQQVEGFTNILGEEIPNFYGLVEYRINEDDIERGYLFNLKPNGQGDWRILKSNR